MALHLKTFITRTITAIVFVLIMLCGLLINPWTFFILFSIIHFGCWIEYRRLMGKIKPAYQNMPVIHLICILLSGWGFMLWMSNEAYSFGSFDISAIGLFCMITGLIASLLTSLEKNSSINFKGLMISFFGLLYISLSCGCMIQLRTEGMIFGNFLGMDLGLVLPLLIIVTIWINDTMAYIVGSLIGKTPFSTVSPKKTWEGTIGGALLAMITITICGHFILKADMLQLIIISFITCVAGIFGDLFESKLKRLANIKDSGKIMPGHGGFLDRFDSLLFATIFVWLYIKLFL